MKNRDKVILAIIIVFCLMAGFVGGCFSGCFYKSLKTQPCPECVQQISRDKYDGVVKETEKWKALATAYEKILIKWRLPLPDEKKVIDGQFNINLYFCETWCPWYKTKLPEVRKEYKESDCAPCETAKRRKTGCTDCQPPPPPPPPPKCQGEDCKPPPPPPPPPPPKDDDPTTDYIPGTPAPGSDSGTPAPGGGTNVITYPVDP